MIAEFLVEPWNYRERGVALQVQRLGAIRL